MGGEEKRKTDNFGIESHYLGSKCFMRVLLDCIEIKNSVQIAFCSNKYFLDVY